MGETVWVRLRFQIQIQIQFPVCRFFYGQRFSLSFVTLLALRLSHTPHHSSCNLRPSKLAKSQQKPTAIGFCLPVPVDPNVWGGQKRSGGIWRPECSAVKCKVNGLIAARCKMQDTWDERHKTIEQSHMRNILFGRHCNRPIIQWPMATRSEKITNWLSNQKL